MPSGCWKHCALFILIIAVLGAGMTGCAALPRDLTNPLRTPLLPTASLVLEPAASEEPTPTLATPESIEASAAITLTTALPTATATATPRPRPTRTATPSLPPSTPTVTVTRRPTRTPTITPTPELPESNIQVLHPGPASKVISPIPLSVYFKPGASGNVQIELWGEDGRLLVRKYMRYTPLAWVHMITDVEFEISAVAEAGRLVISTTDDKGRIVSLNSVELILMSMGDSDTNPPGPLSERIVIRQPRPKALIQGGTLQVTGLVFPLGTGPLLVEILDKEGNLLGPSRLVTPGDPLDEYYRAFSVDMPYTVSKAEWVLLVVSEHDERLYKTYYLSSVEVFAAP